MILEVVYEFVIAILIGLTQGITEFLPISSTAHMRIVAGLLAENRDIGQATGNFIQLGTVIAVVIYFWAELKEFWFRSWQLVLSRKERKRFVNTLNTWIRGRHFDLDNADHITTVDITLAQLAIATVPIAIIGFILRDITKDIRDFYSIAGFLLFGSGLMAFSEYTHRIISNARPRPFAFYTLPEVVLIGLFQTLAIFPGVSRSGATLAGTLMLGHERKGAVRFSFLLSLPALILAGLLSVYDLFVAFGNSELSIIPGQGLFTEFGIQLSIVSLVIAAITAFVSGYVSLRWLLKYLSSNSFRPFIIYRLLLVAFLVGAIFFGFTG